MGDEPLSRQIDLDNFDDLMEALPPRLRTKVLDFLRGRDDPSEQAEPVDLSELYEQLRMPDPVIDGRVPEYDPEHDPELDKWRAEVRSAFDEAMGRVGRVGRRSR